MLEKFKISRSDFPYITHAEVHAYNREIDVECAIREGREIVRRAKREDKRREKRRQKIKGEKKPFWFRSLSHNQIAAANMIFSALQRPTLRDQLKCVNHITPSLCLKTRQPTQYELAMAIEYARRSDLAFLWHLYKIVYKTAPVICTQRKFTRNERIILSCICHLDMMVTLRELEKILPPPPVDAKVKKVKDPVKILKPLPGLEIYEIYKDEFLIIENESNRWFQRDFLVPSTRHCWAQQIIADSVNKSSDDHQKEKSSKLNEFLHSLRQKDNSDACKLPENLTHLTPFEQKVTCTMHKEYEREEENFKHEQEEKETSVVATALVTQLANDAFDRRFLHLCTKCDDDSVHRRKLHPRERATSSYDPRLVKFFHRTSIGSGKFDYDKIFSPHFAPDHDAVKKSINAALEVDKYLTRDNAITACLRDMWRAKRREWRERRRAEIELRQRRVVADCSGIAGDKERALGLLRQGIALMRKNPKFVLAALPHAHRLPILKEWTMRRYGVEFVYEQ